MMDAEVTTIHFDKNVFPIPPPFSQVKVSPAVDGLAITWEALAPSSPFADPHSYDLQAIGFETVKITGEVIIRNSGPISLFVSREGQGANTVYTINMQDSHAVDLGLNLSIPLRDFLKVHPLPKFNDEKTKNAATEFIKGQLSHLFEASDEFYAHFFDCLSIVDFQNHAPFILNDKIEVNQAPPPPLSLH